MLFSNDIDDNCLHPLYSCASLQSGEAANGTQFMITRAPEPSLDKTNLIVGVSEHTSGSIVFLARTSRNTGKQSGTCNAFV
jgi:hypothetical protein